MKTKTEVYRGETLQQNPLTGDWLVMLPEPYGAYCGTLSGMRKVIDRYVGICIDCQAEVSVCRIGKMVKHGATHTPCRFKPNRGSIHKWRDTKTGVLIGSVPRQFDPAKRDVLDAMRRWNLTQQVAG